MQNCKQSFGHKHIWYPGERYSITHLNVEMDGMGKSGAAIDDQPIPLGANLARVLWSTLRRTLLFSQEWNFLAFLNLVSFFPLNFVK